jgi:hypothetical protein
MVCVLPWLLIRADLLFKRFNIASAGAVIRALHFRRKETAGQFIVSQVILHTLAAFAFSDAGLIGARAGFHVFSEVTIHLFSL